MFLCGDVTVDTEGTEGVILADFEFNDFQVDVVQVVFNLEHVLSISI